MIKISVIIPVYNAVLYVRECLDSVASQTLNEIEIICVNDGSTDNSLEILNDYAKKDKRIIVFDQENAGPATARNKALKEATGIFVAFMDPDDYYPSQQVLEQLYKTAVKNDVKICGGSLSRMLNNVEDHNWGGEEKYFIFTEEKLINYKDYQFDCGYTRFIYSREMLSEKNICFPDYRRFEDPPFFVKAMIEAQKFYVVSNPVYCYRIAPKKKKFSETITADILRGLIENLKISRENDLQTLHRITVNNLNSPLIPFIMENAESIKVLELLVSFNNNVDINLLNGDNAFIKNGCKTTALLEVMKLLHTGLQVYKIKMPIRKVYSRLRGWFGRLKRKFYVIFVKSKNVKNM